jgi:hypothetical protein
VWVSDCDIPSISTGALYEGLTRNLRVLRERGGVPRVEGGIRSQDMYSICGLKEVIEFDLAARSSVYASGV